MRMEEVNENEIANLERQASMGSQKRSRDEISDEQLIAMTRATLENQDNSSFKEKVARFKDENDTVYIEEDSLTEPQINEPFPQQRQDTGTNYWEIKGLPSKGRFYPAGSRLVGRPLKVLEVKKIATINDENADFVINDVLRKAIRLDGMNFEDILVADKLFLIMWLRANTYRESGYVVNFKCDKCQKESNFHYELNDLEVQEVSDKYDPNTDITLPSGNKIRYRYLTIGDELYINKFLEMNTNKLVDVDAEILGLARMITSINGEENKTIIQKYHWLISDTGDFAYIANYTEKHGMSIKPYLNVDCKKCGGTSLVGISFRSDFFIPEYQID